MTTESVNLTNVTPLLPNLTATLKLGLAQFLPPTATEVNEEQLFIGEVSRELMNRGGDTMVNQFQSKVTDLSAAAVKNKRRLQLEDAGTQAITAMVAEKKIPKTIAAKIIKTAWTAAQLDSNPALWDSIDGPNDPTRAVAKTGAAIASVDSKLAQIASGKLVFIDPASVVNNGLPRSNLSATGVNNRLIANPSSDSTTIASETTGSSMLWKPIANSSNTASFLISADIGKQASSVEIISADGVPLDSGRFTSFGDDGLRAKYVFGKPGSAYPAGSSVVVTLQSGEQVKMILGDPASRIGT